jgi:hypothetical protein
MLITPALDVIRAPREAKMIGVAIRRTEKANWVEKIIFII